MSQRVEPGLVDAPSLLRVTVFSCSRRVDLVLPGSVPVAELLPELARSVGLLSATTVHGGFGLLKADGRQLVGDSGLVAQGVGDGAVLIVSAGRATQPPRTYDDVVEAMADVVQRDLPRWSPDARPRTALAAAAMLMVIGGAAALLQDDRLRAGVAACTVSVALVAGATVLSRVGIEPGAVVIAWIGTAYAALGGLMLAWGAADDAILTTPLACAGGATALVGMACAIGLRDGRALMLTPVVAGSLFLASGLLTRGFGLDPGVVLTSVLTVAVLGGDTFPVVALSVTRTRVDQFFSSTDITAAPPDIDPARVRSDARLAHQILLAILTALGILLVLVVPLAVRLGVAGISLVAASCLVVMLRTRRYVSGQLVGVGLAFGLLGLATVAVSVLWTYPIWRAATSVTLVAAGAAILIGSVVAKGQSLRRAQVLDVAETCCLIALLPLLVVASGLFAAIAD